MPREEREDMTLADKAIPDQEDMEVFIDEAIVKRLLIRTSYQGLTFHPQELRDHRTAGGFRWGRRNWTHVDPLVEADEEDRKACDAEASAVRWRASAAELRAWAKGKHYA